jgi:hypothetical protein
LCAQGQIAPQAYSNVLVESARRCAPIVANALHAVIAGATQQSIGQYAQPFIDPNQYAAHAGLLWQQQFGQPQGISALGQLGQLGQIGHPGQSGQIGHPGQIGQIGHPGQIGYIGQLGHLGQAGQQIAWQQPYARAFGPQYDHTSALYGQSPVAMMAGQQPTAGW